MPSGIATGVRQQSARDERISRDEYVIEDVDHEIEHVARPARQHFGDAQPPRKGAVNAVDEERNAEPDEHLRPVGCGPPQSSAKSAQAAPQAVKMWTAKAAAVNDGAAAGLARGAIGSMRHI